MATDKLPQLSTAPTHPDRASPDHVSKLVVHIIDRMPPDGAERLIVEVLRYRSPHYNYHLLCLAEGGALVSDVTAMGVPVTILSKQPGIDLRHGWCLWRWLRRQQPHIVHTHLSTADNWGRTFAWLAGVPGIFATIHSTNNWKSRIHLLVDRCLASVSTHIVACSSVVEQTLLEQGLSRQKLISIPNGVDLNRIENAARLDVAEQFSIPGDHMVFAVIGRLHEAKGHADLLPVLQELASSGYRFVVLFVGEGELESELKAVVSQKQLTDYIRFTGFRQDVISILKSIDYLLMPSRWEGLPITLLESMACGTPALASRVGGIPDVIEQHVNGVLYDAGDHAALKQEILTLLTKAQRDTRMSVAARNTVRRRYSAEAVASAYEALYDKVN